MDKILFVGCKTILRTLKYGVMHQIWANETWAKTHPQDNAQQRPHK